MNNNHLVTGDGGVNGIYRCKLLMGLDSSDIRVYVPGISSIHPFDSDGNIDVETYEANKDTFPKVQWCCYNVESKEFTNQDPLCWCMFENGDFKKPVVISYAIIGGSGSGSGSGSLYDFGDSWNKTFDESKANWVFLGSDFVITHYCIEQYAHICNDGNPSTTASGTTPTPGRTIAVDPSVIPLGSYVKIDGHVYVAEDTGGAIKGHKIDIVVKTHAEAIQKGTRTGVSVYYSTTGGWISNESGGGGTYTGNDIIEKAISAWESDCKGKSYGRGTNQYDCSSSTSHAFMKAGVLSTDAYTTGNAVSAYTTAGFKDVTSSVGLDSYANLKRGDVLWSNGHMCIYLGNGQVTKSNSRQGNDVGNWYKFATTVLRYEG